MWVCSLGLLKLPWVGGGSQAELTVRVVQQSLGDDGLQLLQVDLLTVPAAAPRLQGHLVDLLATSVAETMGDAGHGSDRGGRDLALASHVPLNTT